MYAEPMIEKHKKVRDFDHSWFNELFVLKDGIISVSLKDLTVLLSVLASVILVILCHDACKKA